MDKQNTVYPSNRLVLGHKKEQKPLIHATTWMNFENIMLSERSQMQSRTIYDSIYMKCPEYANLQRQKVDQRLPEAAGRSGE